VVGARLRVGVCRVPRRCLAMGWRGVLIPGILITPVGVNVCSFGVCSSVCLCPRKFISITGRRRSASVGKSNKRQACSYGMLPTMIWRARHWTISSVLDFSFVRLVCQAGHAYSRIGRATVWKKYARSSLTTPAHFNFFKNQICLAALDVIALT